MQQIQAITMPSKSNKGLKLSFSKSLFCEKTTEIRTFQNDLIGTIKENHPGRYLAQNIQNHLVELCSYDDAKVFILNSYISLGKPQLSQDSWQLALF